MSYRIEYQFAVFVDDSTATRQYVVAIEGGDNNLYENRSGRRVRHWEATMLGTETSVLKRAVYFAAACPGGGLKPMGRDCTPESYVARIRRLITAATPTAASGYWYPDVRLPKAHAAVRHARSLRLAVDPDTCYGDRIERVRIPADRRDLVFEFAARFPDLAAWSLVKVAGLPAS